MLTLLGTHCVHTSMNVRKMKFISYIYTLFIRHFCSVFVKFECISFKTNMFACYIQQPFPWRRPINSVIYPWPRLRVKSREQLSFIGVWTLLVQNKFILGNFWLDQLAKSTIRSCYAHTPFVTKRVKDRWTQSHLKFLASVNIYRRMLIDRVALSLGNVTDKQTPWLVDWR